MPKEFDKALTLSLIIPVYNEERYLKACLESVASQSVLPDEVLVIDNNSTDSSAAIARSFDFVRVIHEPKQGLIAARNRGFNEAKGSVLARIDADATLKPGWTERIKHDFNDETVSAIAGLAYTDVYAGSRAKTRLWSYSYFLMREIDFGIYIMWGANMALRASAWQVIKKEACLDDTLVHEDQDISFLLSSKGMRIARDNKFLVQLNGDEYNELPKFFEYMRRAAMTKRRHKAAMNSPAAQSQKINVAARLLRVLVLPIPTVWFLVMAVVRFFLNGFSSGSHRAVSHKHK